MVIPASAPLKILRQLEMLVLHHKQPECTQDSQSFNMGILLRKTVTLIVLF